MHLRHECSKLQNINRKRLALSETDGASRSFSYEGSLTYIAFIGKLCDIILKSLCLKNRYFICSLFQKRSGKIRRLLRTDMPITGETNAVYPNNTFLKIMQPNECILRLSVNGKTAAEENRSFFKFNFLR